MSFEVTSAVRKMLAMTARKKVIQGATSSGKTYGIIPIIIDKCIATPRLKATVVAESIPAVKDGCVDIFQDFMHTQGRWRDQQWIGNPMQYTFLNGSKIQFKSFDSVGKAKAAGKRDLLFMNEANHIPYPIADALMIRSQEVWMDFNADAEFWAHTEVLREPYSEFLKLTYLDNEAIPQSTLQDLLFKRSKAEAEDAAGMRGYWWNWWQVYGLGEIGSLDGVVFSNWGDIDILPADAKLIGYGMDFGFTNDPTTLTAIYQWNGKYILDEVIYQTGLTNSELANLMKAKGVSKSVKIYADSAEPKTIRDLNNYGFRVVAAEKGADSIDFGISKMQEVEFLITKRSVNTIKEFRGYCWDKNKEGQRINKPIDFNNHAIDGIRYYFTTKDKYSGRYVISSV